MRRAWCLVPAVLSLGIASACGNAPADTERSEAAHTQGQYAWSNNPLQWADSTYEELRTNRDTLLPDDHPLTRRLQYWADRIDGIVRPEAERRLGGRFAAPHPRIKVAADASDFNAWVSSVAGCGRTTVAPASGEAAESSAVPAADHVDDDASEDVALLTPAGIERSRPTLFHPRGWPRGAAFASLVNDSALGCRLAGDGGALTTACTDRPAAHLAITATSPWIHVTTAFAAGLDEKAVVFLLSHELAHYYRAHPSPLNKHQYRFWYEADALVPARPLPSADAKELEATYLAATSVARPVGGPGLVSLYPVRLRRFVVEVAAQLASHAEPNLPCRAAAEAARGGWTGELLDKEMPSPEARAKYLAFEVELAVCAPAQNLSDRDAPGSLNGSALRARLPTSLGTSIESGASLGELLGSAEAAARALDAEQEAAAARIRQNRIGLYTHEQEADELALEIMTTLGVPAPEAIAAWIDAVVALDAHADAVFGPGTAQKAAAEHGTLDGKACAELAKQGFTAPRADGSREPVFVSLGQLGDAHHADCYRIFNLTREARAHRYVSGGSFPRLEPAWSVLREQARTLAR